jgi:hypothetical protein
LTIKPEVRNKILEMAQQRKGRNQIVYELSRQNIKASAGFVSSVLRECKNKNRNDPTSKSSTSLDVINPVEETSSINATVDESNVGHSSSRNGVELASELKVANEYNSGQEIDFDDQAYETIADNLLSGDYSEILDGESGERLLNFTTTVEPEGLDILPSDSNYVIKKARESTTEENQPQSRLYRSKNCRIEEKSRDTSLDLDLDIDCDATNYQANFTAWVFEQKRRRGVEQRSLDLYRKRITEDRSRLESEKSNFEAQKMGLEAQIAQVNELMPIAVQLKAMGFDFALANSWLNCVAEMAQRKGLDLRSAAWRLADDLKNWQELGGFETAISNAKHQLSLLNLALEDQKAAIATLVNLQKMGMSEIEISRLVKLVNGWGKGNGNFANGLELDTHINLPSST